GPHHPKDGAPAPALVPQASRPTPTGPHHPKDGAPAPALVPQASRPTPTGPHHPKDGGHTVRGCLSKT
ncbi:hypothetical protein ACPCSK_31485, partial [Streptomyces griseoincarnatus]